MTKRELKLKFENFKEIIEGLQKAEKRMENTQGIIEPEFFEPFTATISLLLNEMYGEFVTSYVINEWLMGNHNPMLLKQDDGSQLSMPVNTVRDLWHAAEKLKDPGAVIKREKVTLKDIGIS